MELRSGLDAKRSPHRGRQRFSFRFLCSNCVSMARKTILALRSGRSTPRFIPKSPVATVEAAEAQNEPNCREAYAYHP